MKQFLTTVFLTLAIVVPAIPTEAGMPTVSPTLNEPGWPAQKSCQSLPMANALPALSLNKAAGPQRKQGAYELPELVGFVINQKDWTVSFSPYGIYGLSASRCEWMEATSELLCPTGLYGGPEASGQLIDDRYYLWTVENDGMAGHAQLRTYDATTWKELSAVGVSDDDIPHEMAYNPSDKKLYGCYVTDDGTAYLGEADLTDGGHRRIITLPFPLEGMAFTAGGTLYGFSADGGMYEVDTESGECRYQLSTYEKCSHPSSAACDWSTGIVYWMPATEDGSTVHAVILQNKMTVQSATLVDGDVFVGASVNPYAALPGAPGAPSRLTTDFRGASLEGSVSFQAATMTYDGQELTGELGFCIYADSKLVVEGRCLPGEEVSADIALATDGLHRFSVNNVNSIGKGVSVQKTEFVGLDTPLPPSCVEARLTDDRHAVVSWQEVTRSANGGFVDYGALEYEVREQRTGCEETLLATTGGSVLELAVPGEGDLAQSRFSVVAVCRLSDTRMSVSEPGLSNIIVTGQCSPPRTFDFSDYSETAYFSWLNAMEDRNNWTFDDNEQAMTIQLLDLMNEHDHWIVSPAVRLEADCSYEISVLVRSLWSAEEKLDFRMGKGSTPDDMTISLGQEEELGETYTRVSRQFTATETATYYFGLHFHSDSEMHTGHPFIKEFAVSEPISGEAPGAVENLSVTTDEEGALIADISFMAPLATLGGNPLDTIEKITLSRNGEEIKSWDRPSPGEMLSCRDEVAEKGPYTYSACAFSLAGRGPETKATAFLGINRPGDISSVHVERVGNSAIALEWQPVNTDIDGYRLNPGTVSYEIYRNTDMDDSFILLDDIRALASFSDVIEGLEETQTFATYGIWPHTEAGYAENYVKTRLLAVGKPYAMPFTDTFSLDGTHIWGMEKEEVSTAQWGYTTSDLTGYGDSDGNGSMMLMEAQQIYNAATLVSGLMELDAELPTLCFDYYVFQSSCRNSVTVQVAVGNEIYEAGSVVCEGATGWREAKFNLDDYAGLKIQLCISGQVADFPYVMIDNIRIAPRLSHDLLAEKLEGTRVARPDEPVEVRFTVYNNGSGSASGYVAELTRDGMPVGHLNGPSIGSGQRYDFVFSDMLNMSQPDSGTYTATIIWDSDMDPSNNSLLAEGPVLYRTALPSPCNLRGNCDKNGISLFWDAPDFNDPQPFTETFECYDWNDYPCYGDWLSADCDGLRPGRFHSLKFDGVGDSPIGFFLVNQDTSALASYYSDFKPSSGHQMMVSLFGTNSNSQTDLGQSDDWLISPLLSGTAQTVKLMACSFSEIRPESFEVLYSMSEDIAIDQFVCAASFHDVPVSWEEYSVALPEGARRFAVRCVSDGKYMLFVDDVTFRPGFAANPVVCGYNVYRDGYRICTTADCFYKGPAPSSTKNEYCVTACYENLPESGPSNKCVIENAGLDTLATADTRIEKVGEGVVISSDRPVPFLITDMQGRVAFSGTVCGSRLVRLAPGIYIVKAGERIEKCMIP